MKTHRNTDARFVAPKAGDHDRALGLASMLTNSKYSLGTRAGVARLVRGTRLEPLVERLTLALAEAKNVASRKF